MKLSKITNLVVIVDSQLPGVFLVCDYKPPCYTVMHSIPYFSPFAIWE